MQRNMKLNSVMAEIRAIKYAPAIAAEVDSLAFFGRTGDASNINLRVLINERQFLLNGVPTVAVYAWGRDCDQYEADSARTYPACWREYLKAEKSMYDGAEGPCSMHVMLQADYATFERSWRDHAAEQVNY